jgi:hypothetical protein
VTAAAGRSRGNPKSQVPNPKQTPNIKLQNQKQVTGRRPLIIANLGFVWDLGFGSWDFQLCWPVAV